MICPPSALARSIPSWDLPAPVVPESQHLKGVKGERTDYCAEYFACHGGAEH